MSDFVYDPWFKSFARLNWSLTHVESKANCTTWLFKQTNQSDCQSFIQWRRQTFPSGLSHSPNTLVLCWCVWNCLYCHGGACAVVPQASLIVLLNLLHTEVGLGSIVYLNHVSLLNHHRLSNTAFLSISTGCVMPLKEYWAISAMLAQDGLAECDQPGKNPLEYSTTAAKWTRVTGRTDSEIDFALPLRIFNNHKMTLTFFHWLNPNHWLYCVATYVSGLKWRTW